jgi:hypothetical protein
MASGATGEISCGRHQVQFSIDDLSLAIFANVVEIFDRDLRLGCHP